MRVRKNSPLLAAPRKGDGPCIMFTGFVERLCCAESIGTMAFNKESANPRNLKWFGAAKLTVSGFFSYNKAVMKCEVRMLGCESQCGYNRWNWHVLLIF